MWVARMRAAASPRRAFARAAGLEDREMEAAVAHLPGLRVLGNLFGIKFVKQVQR
jgi:hypothetical protein